MLIQFIRVDRWSLRDLSLSWGSPLGHSCFNHNFDRMDPERPCTSHDAEHKGTSREVFHAIPIVSISTLEQIHTVFGIVLASGGIIRIFEISFILRDTPSPSMIDEEGGPTKVSVNSLQHLPPFVSVRVAWFICAHSSHIEHRQLLVAGGCVASSLCLFCAV